MVRERRLQDVADRLGLAARRPLRLAAAVQRRRRHRRRRRRQQRRHGRRRRRVLGRRAVAVRHVGPW